MQWILHEKAIQCTCLFVNGQPNGGCTQNKMGGTYSRCLMEDACKLWRWYLLKDTTVSVEYLPGQENWIADRVSVNTDSSRMEAPLRCIHANLEGVGTVSNRSVCLIAQSSVTRLYHLEARPICSSVRRFQLSWNDQLE